MYENLDFIADNFNPTILLLSLLLLATRHREKWKGYLAMLLFSAVWVYGLRYLDIQFNIWGGVGLDYSTHSAVSVALGTLFFVMETSYAKWVIPVISAYFGLELFQKYHSPADIGTTLFAMLPLIATARLFDSKEKIRLKGLA